MAGALGRQEEAKMDDGAATPVTITISTTLSAQSMEHEGRTWESLLCDWGAGAGDGEGGLVEKVLETGWKILLGRRRNLTGRRRR